MQVSFGADSAEYTLYKVDSNKQQQTKNRYGVHVRERERPVRSHRVIF